VNGLPPVMRPSGKGVAWLTGSGAHAAPYPFTTRYPEPGMMRYEDIHFQLVDLPAVASEQPVSWLATALETADAALLVVDLGEPRCVEQVAAVHALLRERRVTLTDRWAPAVETGETTYPRSAARSAPAASRPRAGSTAAARREPRLARVAQAPRTSP
jgi:ribosome-interacting GTPase 1